MKKMSGGLLALVLVFLLSTLWTQPAAAEVVDRIVAQVNDHIITLSELEAASKSIEAQSGINPKGKDDKAIKRQMLEALIDRKLAQDEAKRRGMKIEDKELEAALANFKKRNNLPDDEALKDALGKAGLTMKELKQNLEDQMIQERLVTVVGGTKALVTDDEVRRYYDEHTKGGTSGGSRVHLRVMQIPFPSNATEAQKEEMKKKAETVLAEIKKGTSFTEAASKYSVAEKDVGFVSLSDLEPRLAEFLSHVKINDVAPALTPQGIQLIQVMERRTGEARPFEEVAPEIRRGLTQMKMEKKFTDWVKTLREKAHIKIML